jgi:hypothetical protein
MILMGRALPWRWFPALGGSYARDGGGGKVAVGEGWGVGWVTTVTLPTTYAGLARQ